MEQGIKPTKQQLFNEEQKKLLKNRKVVQLNKFVKGDVSAFTVNDLKVFKLIISKVDSKDSLFKEFYEITTDEIKALNINEKHLYSIIRKTLKTLANIYITFDEGDSVREVGLIRNDFKFEKYTKKILINFNDDMDEYLINLKKNFFMYDLIDIVNFKFKHTIKFYEYIKSQSLNVIKLKIETIKGILDLKNKYSRYTNFRADVLEVILEEINASSNTLYVSYTEERIGPKVEYIIFHVKRIKSDLLLDDNTNKNKYGYLLGKECEYLNKFHTLENIDIENNLIVLREVLTSNHTNIVKDNELGVEETLKKLFKKDYIESSSVEEEPNEIQRLLTVKDFKKFREQVIVQYSGKQLANGVPGFEPEEIISVQDQTGYLVNGSNGKVITKEESLIIWRYLYKNRNLVGKIEVENPTKRYNNKIIYIHKNNEFGDRESFKYMVTDIKEEKDEEGNSKYRLFIQNLNDPFQEIEKSKSLLTIEQLKIYIEESSKTDN
ncbi:MAG: replication initiation protein [Candidatus Cloacimonetes bacterium]|nr:replication initiation protein [Candidatus Cloacimonadota bacterium]